VPLEKWVRTVEVILFKLMYSVYIRSPSVHYHVDLCTKNKCMIWIPTCGLFLTCTESFLFYQAHTQYTFNDIMNVYYLQEKMYPYLERRSLAHGDKSSSLVPCFKWTAFKPLALPLTSTLAFPPTVYLFTYRWHCHAQYSYQAHPLPTPMRFFLPWAYLVIASIYVQ
jgi:hypothetical protein